MVEKKVFCDIRIIKILLHDYFQKQEWNLQMYQRQIRMEKTSWNFTG